MSRYTPSRHYLTAGCIAIGLAAFSSWVAWQWAPAYIAAFLFVASAAILFVLAFQPAVQVSEEHLAIGKKLIRWSEIQRLDRTSWISPLIVHLTLAGDRRLMLVYPGDVDSGKSLLRHLRRCARGALIDGIPYRQFWGELLGPAGDRRTMQAPKYQLLRPEDEAEVERLFQMLKTVGHIEPKNLDEN